MYLRSCDTANVQNVPQYFRVYAAEEVVLVDTQDDSAVVDVIPHPPNLRKLPTPHGHTGAH